MPHGSSTPEPTFGYLSVVRSAEHGYFGGYLVISALGRPLEFHCSAPVRPSRAQEILYGPTMEPYLLGELIGGTLLSRSKTSPRLIVTDQPAALGLRSQMDVPIVYFMATISSQGGNPDNIAEIDQQFEVGVCQFAVDVTYLADKSVAMELLSKLAERVDLAEPFDRIHEAIREAQRIGTRGQDTHGQAA